MVRVWCFVIVACWCGVLSIVVCSCWLLFGFDRVLLLLRLVVVRPLLCVSMFVLACRGLLLLVVVCGCLSLFAFCL